jgi:2,3-bisphosphoglycerate-dependent phosphoglycerate mutase
MTVRLMLVRHGATEWSDAGRLNGWTDVPLNGGGKARALGLGAVLAPVTFTGVWSSDLRRSTETADLAVGGAAPDARLRELDFGRLEGSRWEDHPPDVQEAMLHFEGFAAPGGESVDQLRDRVHDFFSGLRSGHHLAFTDGGVIRLLLREIGNDQSVAPGDLVAIEILRSTVHLGEPK